MSGLVTADGGVDEEKAGMLGGSGDVAIAVDPLVPAPRGRRRPGLLAEPPDVLVDVGAGKAGDDGFASEMSPSSSGRRGRSPRRKGATPLADIGLLRNAATSLLSPEHMDKVDGAAEETDEDVQKYMRVRVALLRCVVCGLRPVSCGRVLRRIALC